MLHIFVNEKSDTNNYIDLNIEGKKITAYCRNNDIQMSGKDIIEETLPYNSYIMVDNYSKVKNFFKLNKSNYKFLDMNRLGVAVRMDFFKLYSLFATHDIMQIDTGMISKDGNVRDIVIRIFEGNKENFHITSDLEYDISTFNTDDLEKLYEILNEEN